MKRILAILLAAMMIFTLAACKSTPSSTDNGGGSGAAGGNSGESGNKSGADLKLAGLVFSDDQFMNALLRGYETAAAEYGATVNLQNIAQDAAREAELLNTFISQGYDGVAIAPYNIDSSIPTLKSASDAGILIATTNMNLRDGAADFIIGGYTSDDFSNGEAMGKYAAEWMKNNIEGQIKLGIVHFDHSKPDQSGARYGGFLASLDASGIDYVIVDSQANSQGDPLGLTSSMIAGHPDMNVIYCCNEGATIAAAKAVQAEGKIGQISVFGYDSSDQTSNMIIDEGSALIGVVTQDPYFMGYNAMKLICEVLLNDKDYSDTQGTSEYVPGEVLVKDNPDAVKKWRTDNGLTN